ncbi:MAG TPA: DUF937 domain-containing protein [Thermoanaerobaculia bacterium]
MDTTPSVLDALEAQLGPETIQQLSAQLGTEPAATSHAISMAVPILLGRLSKNASDADGAAALDTALTQHDGGILGNLGSLLSGGAGAAILGHILGSRRAPVEQGVGRATGLNAGQVGQLLTLLAPIVMAVLGKMKRQQNVGAEQLPAVLGQANLDMSRQSTAVGDLSRVLDTDDNDGIADDISRIGSTILNGMLGRGAGA